MEKLEWCGGEKNFEDIFIRFDTMHERDRHTDGHRTTAAALYASHRAAKTVREVTTVVSGISAYNHV